MTDSLRNQLLGLGFKPAPDARRNDASKRGGKPQHRPAAAKAGAEPRKPNAGRGAPQSPRARKGGARSQEDIDLAKAYAIRAQREKDERIAAERAKQEEARKRREARARLAELVKGKSLNAEDADIARHFPYGGKIKRVYVTADQLRALNAGELGVLQMDGRYLLVTAELMAQAEQAFAPAVALKIDPDAPAADDPYADPKYQVPDDLVW